MMHRVITSEYDEHGNAVAYAKSVSAITPSDSATFAQTRGIYVGGAGNVAVTMADGSTATFTALATGIVHQLSVTQIKATGTTATSILALY